MSNTSKTTLVCANCGKEDSDVTNTCNKCKMVMYCNAACKKRHRHKHKKECERRVAELYDEKLFKQPPRPHEDCPICMIRLPNLGTGRVYMECCGKLICRGCFHAFQSRITKRKDDVCPFCRTANYTSDEEMMKRFNKRAELNDTQALCDMGYMYRDGEYGLSQSYAKALKLWHRAAELGNADAYCNIGYAYKLGKGVEADEKKAKHYYELAAMGGNATARYNLGIEEAEAGNMDRVLMHLMIAARDGESDSLKNIKYFCFDGLATKDDYAKALRSYQAYLDEIKSDQRDEAAAYNEEYKYYESNF